MGFKRSWVQIPPARDDLSPRAMFYVYVLKSAKTGRRYVGSCQNVGERVRRHNAAQSKATRHGIPWKLIRTEGFLSRQEAIIKERYYKTGRGRDELDRLPSPAAH